LTTYDAGPMPDPCTILALMGSIVDVAPPYCVRCLWPAK